MNSSDASFHLLCHYSLTRAFPAHVMQTSKRGQSRYDVYLGEKGESYTGEHGIRRVVC